MVVFLLGDVFETDPAEYYSALVAVKRVASIDLLHLRAAAGAPLVLVPFVAAPAEVIGSQTLAFVPFDAAAEAHICPALRAAYLLLAVAAGFLN